MVDWEVTDLSILRDLLQAVKRWGGFNLLRTWSATLSHESLNLLTEEGFKPASLSKGAYRPGLLVRALKESTADESWVLGGRCLLNQDDWDLRMIQSDRF